MAVRRQYVLAGLFVAVGIVALLLLFEVAGTVFFAVTVAYVLYPLRRRLVARGASPRVASLLATALAFLAVVAIVAPLGGVLYRRWRVVFDLLQALPQRVPVGVGEFVYVVRLDSVFAAAQAAVASVAVDVARATPVLALKLVLFAFVLFALLLRPLAVRELAFELAPDGYHDVVLALHHRVRDTLYAIYVVQAVTAFGTFVVALAVFGALGYDSPLVLAVLAGVLQFVPVVGPSVVVLALAAFDLAFGATTRALLVAVFGLLLVGFLPDALIRPRLAKVTAHIPVSVYFIGFTGGVLSVGAVGFIAGPLVVALLIEVVELLIEESDVEPEPDPAAE